MRLCESRAQDERGGKRGKRGKKTGLCVRGRSFRLPLPQRNKRVSYASGGDSGRRKEKQREVRAYSYFRAKSDLVHRAGTGKKGGEDGSPGVLQPDRRNRGVRRGVTSEKKKKKAPKTLSYSRRGGGWRETILKDSGRNLICERKRKKKNTNLKVNRRSSSSPYKERKKETSGSKQRRLSHQSSLLRKRRERKRQFY